MGSGQVALNKQAKTIYVCNECGADFPKWQGQCAACGAWNSLSEFVTDRARPGAEDRVGGDWMAAPVPAQMDALRELEGGPTFFYLRNRTIESLYRNPVVWQLVGYEGSSIEYGGYIDRGFDDIDWL